MTSLSSIILYKFSHWINTFLNLILPPRCFGCGDLTTTANQLCGVCWKSLKFITSPYCDQCGHPFIVDESYLICGDCMATPPLFTKGRSAFQYDSLVRENILSFKHADATHLAKPFGRWLYRAAEDILPHCDAIIPVPLHRWRLLKRRYNQATLLAKEVSKLGGIPLLTNVLIRYKHTESQHGKSRRLREKNVKSVFSIAPQHSSLIKNKSFLLIDDVWTTGATISNCVKVLKRSGAKNVYVLTLARVIKTG